MNVCFVTAVSIYVIFNTLTFSATLRDDEKQLRTINKAIEQNEETQRILGNIDKPELVVISIFVTSELAEGKALFIPQSENTEIAYDNSYYLKYCNESLGEFTGELPNNDRLACYKAFRLTDSEDRRGTVAMKDPEKWQAFLQTFKKRKLVELEQEALSLENEKKRLQ